MLSGSKLVAAAKSLWPRFYGRAARTCPRSPAVKGTCPKVDFRDATCRRREENYGQGSPLQGARRASAETGRAADSDGRRDRRGGWGIVGFRATCPAHKRAPVLRQGLR